MVFTPDGLFLTTWYLSAATVVILPLFVFGGARLQHDRGEYDSYYTQEQDMAEREYYYRYQKCAWYQFGCSDWYNPCYGQQNSYGYYGQQQQQQQQEGGEEGQQYQQNQECREMMERQDQEAMENGNGYGYGYTYNYSPWWYLWAEDERRTDQVNGVNPTLVVIYIWTLCTIAFLALHGHKSIVFNTNLSALSASLFVFANCSFLAMLYLGGLTGAVEDDGEVMIAFGWYGQFGVLMYMTYLLCAIWGAAYFIIVRGIVANRSTTKVDVTPSDYLPYKEEKKSLASGEAQDEFGSQPETPPVV